MSEVRPSCDAQREFHPLPRYVWQGVKGHAVKVFGKDRIKRADCMNDVLLASACIRAVSFV